MSTPTAPPWALRGYQIRAANGHGQHIATYYTNEADGHVLAAAAELLQALEAVQRSGGFRLGTNVFDPEVEKLVNAAIVKARPPR